MLRLVLLTVLALHAAGELLVIGHRGGFLGIVPEHTPAAYWLGAEQGAAYLEPDLVMSKDGVLVVLHQNELSEVTNVAELSQFADRYVTRTFIIEGRGTVSNTGWFAEDFTVAELKTLSVIARVNGSQVPSVFNAQYQIMTFDEALKLVTHLRTVFGTEIGVYPELKTPSYYHSINMPPEDIMLETLVMNGYLTRTTSDVQQGVYYSNIRFRQSGRSMAISSLRYIRERSDVPLTQLMYDKASINLAANSLLGFSDEDMQTIAKYADGIGLWAQDPLLTVSDILVAKGRGLYVHAFTVDRDVSQYCKMVNWGVDGVWTNHVDVARLVNGGGENGAGLCLSSVAQSAYISLAMISVVAVIVIAVLWFLKPFSFDKCVCCRRRWSPLVDDEEYEMRTNSLP